MDDMDLLETVRATEDRLEHLAVIADLELCEPVAAPIKRLFGKKFETAPVKPKITKAQQDSLNVAWQKRVTSKRRLDDNEDNNKVTALKNEYFAAIEDYKALYRRIYGVK
jgi:hypothetical protein